MTLGSEPTKIDDSDSMAKTELAFLTVPDELRFINEKEQERYTLCRGWFPDIASGQRSQGATAATLSGSFECVKKDRGSRVHMANPKTLRAELRKLSTQRTLQKALRLLFELMIRGDHELNAMVSVEKQATVTSRSHR